MAQANNRFDKGALVRLTSWGAAAATALMLAALSTVSSTGSQRVGVAIATLTGAEPQQVTMAQAPSRAVDTASERRRFDDAIRLLAADRDRLLTRVSSIERNLDDITGSINRQPAAQTLPQVSGLQPQTTSTQRAEPAAPAEASAASAIAAPSPHAANAPWPTWAIWPGLLQDPANIAQAWPIGPADETAARAPATPPQASTRVASAPAAAANSDAPAASTATRTEFGVDIGGRSNLDELRDLWSETRTEHARLLAGLRPIVVVREGKTGGLDMRLVVGPLANAGAAARLCARLGAADVMCSTAPFEGQRLAVR